MPIPMSDTSIPTSKSSPSSSESQTDPIVEIETELLSTPYPSETSPSHTTISHILSSLATLQSDFAFPTQLDFAPSATSSSSKLAYTSANAPVHQYEHQLTGLLTQLDAVESYGDEDVRKARKDAVKAIEKELEELDGKKAEAWRRMTGHEEAVGEEVENSALMEIAINMDVSQPEKPTTVADESQQEAAGCDSTVDPSCVPLPQDEEADESIYHPSSTSMSTPPNPTLVPPHSLMPSSPALPPTNITLANVTTSSSAPASSTSQLPRSSTSFIQPSPDADKPRQTSLNESTGSEISESELDEFVEIDADMDVETMSITSAEEVEQDKGLAAMSDWEVNF
ncbi:hypothetical protein BDV93DRAFT_80133 [Ceratobasidium sp. AG-I]|nr:hypothetical protein BDV93DRAFT_80133 [Ceratobasidium sp. AG-I]